MDFETSKSVNPFLMDDVTDYVAEPQNNGGPSSNPFLNLDFGAEATGKDNPFLSESYHEHYDLPDTNPFASFAADYNEPTYQNPNELWQQTSKEQEFSAPATEDFKVNQQEIQDVKKPFLGEQEARPSELGLLTTTINDADNDLLLSSDEELSKPKRPPPPHPSMPKETQDLILSVTGALEATSHHLLDRLPPTRAPSPTAFPDFQSLSPTPDAFADLLGTPKTEPSTTLPQFSGTDDISGTPKPEKAAPPPRPPPARPAPPKTIPPSQPPKPAQQEVDMFDLFGTSKPPPPKTKDAILNLYSQPKPPPKDLLTDDFDIPSSTPSLLDNNIRMETSAIDLVSSKVQSENQTQPEEASIITETEVKETSEEFTLAPAKAPESSNETPALINEQKEEIPSENHTESNIFEVQEPELIDKSPEIKGGPGSTLNSVIEEEPHYIFGTKPPENSSENQLLEAPSTEPLTFNTEISFFETESSQLERSEANKTLTESKPSFDAFDAFAAKFESTGTTSTTGGDLFDPFSGSEKSDANGKNISVAAEYNLIIFSALFIMCLLFMVP